MKTIELAGAPAGASVSEPAGEHQRQLPWLGSLGSLLASAPGLFTFLAILLLLELASRAGWVDPRTLPPISGIAAESLRLVAEPGFWLAVGQTLTAWGIGLAISAAIGIPLGILISVSAFGFHSTQFVIDFLRTIPPVTVVPIALLVCGPTLSMSLVLIVYGCGWVIVLQTIQGLRQLEPAVRDTATSFRIGLWFRITRVVLPSAAPLISTGLRIATTLSLLLAVGSEVVGGAPGLGSEIALAQQGTQVERIYALVAMSALLGLVMNVIYERIERSVLSWHPSHRKAVNP